MLKMEEERQLWEDIFFIHQYFVDASFSFKFINTYYHHLRKTYSGFYQSTSLYDVYSSITGKDLPTNQKVSDNKFRSIEYIIIDNLRLDSLIPLEQFHDIKFLNANSNNIDSIIPLKKFVNLESIDLSSNIISNIEPLKKFHNLKHLNLADNNLSSISSISKLENLITLHIQGNKVDDLPDLSDLQHLKELYIGNNRITSLSGLKNLKGLEKLDVGYNPLPIEDLQSIKMSLPNCMIYVEEDQLDESDVGWSLNEPDF